MLDNDMLTGMLDLGLTSKVSVIIKVNELAGCRLNLQFTRPPLCIPTKD